MAGKKSITVRPALVTELRDVLALLVEFHGELPPIPLSMPKLLRTVVTVMQEGVILVALRDGEIVGTMGIAPQQWWFSEAWYLSDCWMFVKKGARRSTAAADILKGARDFSDKTGLPIVPAVASLHRTDRKNALYRRYFTPIGERFIHGLDVPGV